MTERDGSSRGEPEDRAFEDIVSRLDLDWSDPGFIESPEPEPDPEPELPPELDLDAMPDDEEDLFYRQVPQGPSRPLQRGRVLAWGGVLGAPALLALCTLLGIWISGPVLLTLGLIVVAGSIYLISQLPERGPSHPDWPDDGAVL